MAEWVIEQIKNRREGRNPVWAVTCPDELPEPDWDNDFGRGMRCRCIRKKSETAALSYVWKHMAEGDTIKNKGCMPRVRNW